MIIIVLLIGILLLLGICVVFVRMRSKNKWYEPDYEPDTIEKLQDDVLKMFNNILRENLNEMKLSADEKNIRIKEKSEIRKALREAGMGDMAYKSYIIRFIYDKMRFGYLGVNKRNIYRFIHFDNSDLLTGRDKWEILIYIYHYKYGNDKDSIQRLILDYELHQKRRLNNGVWAHVITKEDIDGIYSNELNGVKLGYEDMLYILAKRIFADTKGFGAADLLFDYSIDEIEGGVSGVPVDLSDNMTRRQKEVSDYSYNSIWIMFSGINIRLEFMGFESQKELIRVCRNIYKYNAPYALSRQNGYVVSTMKDGSRVVVARPPFSDSWTFLVRKFDSVMTRAPEELIKDENNYIPINIMKWFIKACLTIGITGQQGTGKTTFLKALIRYIPENLNLRIQEMTFEMALRAEYPERNILTFQETGEISAQEGLDFQKKTNGAVNILGEISTSEAATFVIQTSMVASRMSMFTHHANTAKSLVRSFRNSLLETGKYPDAILAEEMVSETINIDCHLEIKDGHRYIERITEIIPAKNRGEDFMTRDIVVFRNGTYILLNMPSPNTLDKINKALEINELKEFEEELDIMNRLSEVMSYES